MKKNGFTLIETLVALVITVASGFILTTAWSGNFLRVRKTALNHNVAQLLERKMIEMESKYQGKKLTEMKEEEGNFGDEYPQYRWTFSAQAFEMPDLAPLIMQQNKNGADQMLLTVMSKMREVVSKSIAEATVTVYVKAAGREVPYSVTTYIVDYESELELSVGQ